MKATKRSILAKPLQKRRGAGLLNSVIDKLPFEVHYPTYQYCGPGDLIS